MKLAVQSRDVIGKKVKYLKQQGLVPGVIYGKHMDTASSVAFDRVQLLKAIRKAGRSTPVELSGDGMEYLVLFHDIQFHPVSDHVLHVDCLAVNKDEKVHAEVPVKLIGEAPFEKNNLGRVQLLITKLEVEALPLDLPHDIIIDISGLEEAGEVLHISDIAVGDNVTLVGDPVLAVLSTVAFKEEAEEEEEVATEGEAGAEGEEAATEEG